MTGHPRIQDYLTKLWLGSRPDVGFQTAIYLIWLGVLYCLEITVAPFIIPISALLYGVDFTRAVKKRLFLSTPPAARYGTTTLFYLLFIVLLLFDSMTTQGIHDPRQFLDTDYMIMVFLVGFVLKEAGELKKQGVIAYFSSGKNLLDVTMLVLFGLSYTIRIVNVVMHHDQILPSAIKASARSGRMSSHAFALGTLVAVLQVLGFLQSVYTIGPILASFRKIFRATLSFLAILAVFLVAFAVALTNIYAANFYTINVDELHHCMETRFNSTMLIVQPNLQLDNTGEMAVCLDKIIANAVPPLQPHVVSR